MSRTKPRATYEDLCKVPDHMVAEIIDGDLITTPRPAAPHALAASMMSHALIGPFGGPPGDAEVPGGWWILGEPELPSATTSSSLIWPAGDASACRSSRMSPPSSSPPDWACEVISMSTAAIDRGRKMGVYAREKVAHLWLVDPLHRTLEVFRLHDGRWVLASTHVGVEQARAEPFDAVPLAMQRWWREG